MKDNMNYLFFDTECAALHGGVAGMCSFGYVLTNDKFEVLEEDDIFMNPGIKFDWYVKKNILEYAEEVYTSNPEFPEHYERIKGLLENNIVIGFSYKDDSKVIKSVCHRYGLINPEIDHYDAQKVYKRYMRQKNKSSLDNAAKGLGLEGQPKKHASLKDARLTMEITKKLCELTNVGIDKLINLDFKPAVVTKTMKKQMNVFHGMNFSIYKFAERTLKPDLNLEQTLAGKTFCISNNYERNNFRNVLMFLKCIRSRGGNLTRLASEANIFVKYDYVNKDGEIRECKRLEVINNRIAEGEKIDIISVEELTTLIQFDGSEVEANYEALYKLYMNDEAEMERLKQRRKIKELKA